MEKKKKTMIYYVPFLSVLQTPCNATTNPFWEKAAFAMFAIYRVISKQ